MGVKPTEISSNKYKNSRNLSTATDEKEEEIDEFSNNSGNKSTAYEVLEVSESCSFDEIKASFRKIAKETHPDVSDNDPHRFLQILAAYEILSDSNKRAHYDGLLFAQRKILKNHSKVVSATYMHNSSITIVKQGDVVEWLKWYRLVIDDIITERRVAVGSGYFDQLESELYSAIRAAYYGPLIESMDFLPDCFEAEERSVYDTSEILHLVSGRDLFGTVGVADKVRELSYTHHEKIGSFNSTVEDISQYSRKEDTEIDSSYPENSENFEENFEKQYKIGASDVYRDLEVHICGCLVATASRKPPILEEEEDQINVFLNLEEDKVYKYENVAVGSRILLGTIHGLRSNVEEGSCSVYDGNGTKTHMIINYRTLMVKHMHWYQVGEEISACECKCSRARLPPSKFWLFEPRCSMHDVGGWYVETYGRDKKGMTTLSQRRWDNIIERPEKRLHPAMYLVALAYRTLDIEDARRRKQTIRKFLEPKLNGLLRWCKKLM